MTRWGTVGMLAALGLASSAWVAGPARAEPAYVSVVREYVDTLVRPMVESPVVVNAIKDQNARFGAIDGDEIQVLDETYRSEVSSGNLQMVKTLLSKPVSHYLKSKVNGSQGTIVDFVVMDAHGLTVGQSAVTPDYWQGDENKFQKTFGQRSSSIFIDRADRDVSTQTLATQASFVIRDAGGTPIGVATVTISIDAL